MLRQSNNHYGFIIMPRHRAIGLILLSALGFGSMALFAKYAYAAGVSPTMLLTLRFFLAAVMLAPLVWIKRARMPRGTALAGFALMGLLYTGQSQSYFTALMHASSGLVGLLLYVYPVLVTLLAITFGMEKPSRRTLMLMALAIAGIAITLGGKLDGEPLGVVLGLLGAAIYALYIVIGGKLTRDADPHAATLVVMSMAAFGNGVLAIGGGHSLPSTAAAWLAIAAIALATAIAISAFLVGIKTIGGAQASIVSTLEPVITICLGVALLGESVSIGQMIGGAMVLTAVILLSHKPEAQAVIGDREEAGMAAK